MECIEEKFEEFVLRNKDLIWYVCKKYSMGDAFEVEDKFHEVVCHLWKAFPRFDSRYPEPPWVYKVAVNTMMTLKRKNIYMQSLDDDTIVDPDNDNEMVVQMQQLIDRLEEKESIIVRAYLDGFSYEEIADTVGITTPMVAMRLMRAKKKLKKMYEDEQ